jgi:glycosyltransferase involved in cell wall biosynthesis
VLISTGRLSPEKGFDRLVELLLPLFCERDRLHLLIVGDGPSRETLRIKIERAQMRDRMHILGRRFDVPQLLGIAEIFLLASRFETFGIAAAEAMMAGRPVVAPRIFGLAEVVESGRTGILVDEACLEMEFAAAVARLLDDPAKRVQMGLAGRERALALFERRRVVNRIIGLYEDALVREKGR